jgi:hypothetical protein
MRCRLERFTHKRNEYHTFTLGPRPAKFSDPLFLFLFSSFRKGIFYSIQLFSGFLVREPRNNERDVVLRPSPSQIKCTHERVHGCTSSPWKSSRRDHPNTTIEMRKVGIRSYFSLNLSVTLLQWLVVAIVFWFCFLKQDFTAVLHKHFHINGGCCDLFQSRWFFFGRVHFGCNWTSYFSFTHYFVAGLCRRYCNSFVAGLCRRHCKSHFIVTVGK